MDFRFIIEEIRHSVRQSMTFVLCVALSIATLVPLNSLKRNVHQSLVDEARSLHGGDIIIHSHQPISARLMQAVEVMAVSDGVSSLNTYEFYSVARSSDSQQSLFSNIKVVEPGYPYYGTIKLESGKLFQQALTGGKIVVARELLDRLGLVVGDRLHIGSSLLTIADVVLSESNRPVSFFSFGPRIFVSSEDLERLGLLGKGSRAEYEVLIRVKDQEEISTVYREIEQVSQQRRERVEIARDARSGVKRFFDNLLFFLSFISIFTLLLSGIGMQGALSAMLRQKQRSIGIIKTLGASYRFLIGHYLALVLILGVSGSILGIMAGAAIKRTIPLLFQKMLPVNMDLTMGLSDFTESLAIGLMIVVLFTFLPIYRLSEVRPIQIFRSDQPSGSPGMVRYLIIGCGLLFLVMLLAKQLEDTMTGLIFSLGLISGVGVIAVVTMAVLYVIRRIPLTNLALRQAVKSLFRAGNGTRSIMVTLTSALTVLLTILLLNLNLFNSFIDSYPEGAPNLFCLDIQKNEQDTFRSLVGIDAPLFPVIRARLLEVNGKPIDQEKEKRRKRDNLGREFNLTYRDGLLDDEIFVKGATLFGTDTDIPPGVVAVSILDTIGDIGNFSINDRLIFNIQGVTIDAQVTSIRSRTQSRVSPFFYFVFEPDVLESAPQTLFAALNLRKDLIPDMITRIVTIMPHVSTVNVSEVALQLGNLLQRLSGIISFFASFSLIAGGLIMVNTIFATHRERIREVVFYKLLGGTSLFVTLVVVYENLILGIISSIMAFCLANIGCWLLCRYILGIAYLPYLGPVIFATLMTIVVILVIGLVGSVGIIRQKPSSYLRFFNGI